MFANTDYLVLCGDSKLQINSLKTNADSFVVEIPNAEMEEKNEKATNVSKATIICGAFSKSGSLLAVCDDRKRLLVWEFEAVKAKCNFKNEFQVARKSVKIVFNSDETQILVGDRSGDVYIYSLDSGNNQGSLLMGHLSMLLDFDLSSDGKYLITCDRDEKIRVSSFPNSYNIHSYCMGHTEFVSSFSFLSSDALISGSGDGTLRVWNYITGDELCQHNCSFDVNQMDKRIAIKQVLKIFDDIVAVLVYGFGCIFFYKLENSNSSYSITFIARRNVSVKPLHRIFICNSLLIASTANREEMFLFFEVNPCSSELTNIDVLINEDAQVVENCLKQFVSEEQSLEGLYKTWFNNVDVYLEKKKERQNAKKLKQCKN